MIDMKNEKTDVFKHQKQLRTKNRTANHNSNIRAWCSSSSQTRKIALKMSFAIFYIKLTRNCGGKKG